MECLLEQGVDTVFGYPGGTILNIYDEFELHGYKDRIRHILTAHEQGASHAADGYARATGKVGVCFATSGPGATNLTTGIAAQSRRTLSPVSPRSIPPPSAMRHWRWPSCRRWCEHSSWAWTPDGKHGSTGP